MLNRLPRCVVRWGFPETTPGAGVLGLFCRLALVRALALLALPRASTLPQHEFDAADMAEVAAGAPSPAWSPALQAAVAAEEGASDSASASDSDGSPAAGAGTALNRSLVLMSAADSESDSGSSAGSASESGSDSESESEGDSPQAPAAPPAALFGDDDSEASDVDITAGAGEAPAWDAVDSDSDGSGGEGAPVGRLEALAAEAEAEEAEAAAEAAEAAADMRAQVEGESDAFYLPSAAELEVEASLPPNLPAIRTRMAGIAGVLGNFKAERQVDRSRADYLACLASDMTAYYGYNPELVEIYLDLFSPGEALAFMEANEGGRPMVIRTNTLKTRRRELAKALINRGVNVEPLAGWSKVALKVYDAPVPIGATPEYMAGHYMLQAPSSMQPVMALGALPGDRVLDMAAAPGGKTTHIAQGMRNQGLLVANDSKKHRLTSLSANLQRLGVTCAVVCNYDGRVLPTVMTGFDRVLLDAPCSGLGVVGRDPSIKTQKGLGDVTKMAAIQKQLGLAAIDCLDANSKTPGGAVFVYSTCSVCVEENEAVVEYLLAHRCVKLVPLHPEGAEDVGEPGFIRHRHRRFHPSMNLTRRFYPHVHNMDGFFVAKFRKYANAIPEGAAMPTGRRKMTPVAPGGALAEHSDSASEGASDSDEPGVEAGAAAAALQGGVKGGKGTKRPRDAPRPAHAGKRKRKSATIPAAVEVQGQAAAVEGAVQALSAKARDAAKRAAAHKSGDAALARVGLSKEQLKQAVAEEAAGAKKGSSGRKGGKGRKGGSGRRAGGK